MGPRLIRIILNPISGAGQDQRFLRDLVRHATLRGFTVEISPTQRPGHAADLARSTPDDAYAIVSLGGDGTHREVLSGLVGRPVPACIVPSGTENVLARTFGLIGTLRETLNVLHRRRFLELDVGLANDHPFILFSGVGFDAAVTQEVQARRHGRIHRTAYYGPILRAWWRYAAPPLTVSVEGRPLCDDAGFVLVANTPLYGGRLRIAPRAVADDGRLDVVCFRAQSRWQLLGLYARTLCGTHLDHPLVAAARGRRVDVTAAGPNSPVQLDGDAVLRTPVSYSVRPRAVRLLVPESLHERRNG